MEKKPVSFDDWLEAHLENENNEYRDAYEKEKFKLELAIKIKKRTEQKYLKENLRRK